MSIKVTRLFKGSSYVIGKLYINNKYFCDTLEDMDRGLKKSDSLNHILKTKVMHQTAIPKGEYPLTLDVVSPKYSNYNKYSWSRQIQGKVPRLLDVPGFEGILIHPGNNDEHTSGCILVGENKVKGKVINSVATFHKLYEELKQLKALGGNMTISIE